MGNLRNLLCLVLGFVAHLEWFRRTAGMPRIGRGMKWIALPLTFVWVVLVWVPFRANDVYIDRMEATNRGARLLIRTASGFQHSMERTLIYPVSSRTIVEDGSAASIPLLTLDRETGVWKGRSPNGSEISIRLHQGGFALTSRVWRSLFPLEDPASKRVCSEVIALVLGILALVHGLNARGVFRERGQRLPDWLFFGLLGAGWGAAIALKSVAHTPFIYFQF